MPPLRAAAASLLAGCLVVSGCGGSAAGAAPDPTGDWELVELRRDGAVVPAPAGGRATLAVADGEVSGTAFCNGYGGAVRVDGDAFAVDSIARTERGCDPDLMDAEAAFLDALQVVERVGSRDGYLVLGGADAELTFREIAPVPTSELAGTNWTLETLLDGEVAASTAGDPATLLLAVDGTLTGSTGCRGITGSWVVEGDVVRLPAFAADEADCPPDVAAQDQQVVAVLGDGFQVAVSGDTLTVTGRDGLGLVYRG